MARIGIDATGLLVNGKGVSRFLGALLSGLAQAQTEHEFVIFVNRRVQLPELPVAKHLDYVPVSVRSSLVWDLVQLPLLLRQYQVSLLHSCSDRLPLFYNGSMLHYVFELPHYRHELEWSQASLYTRLSMKITELLFPISLRRATRVVVSSQATCKAIAQEYRVAAKTMQVIYLGKDEAFSPVDSAECQTEVRERFGAPHGYILHFSSDWRDNTAVALRSFQRSLEMQPHKAKLVIGGRVKSPELKQLASDLQLEDRVVWAGFIPEETLADVYGSAALYLDPSLYEGFGLQVLEAMACGVPVVCSNVTSLPEIIGDAGISASPEDIEAFACRITQILSSPEYAACLRAMGLARAASFTWASMVAQFMDVYEQIVCE